MTALNIDTVSKRPSTDTILRMVRALSKEEVQRLLGFSLRNGRGNCPLHAGSDSKSFVLFEMKDGRVGWKCHTVCGSGDALALIAKANGLDTRSDFKKAVAVAGDLLGITNGGSGGLSIADLDRLEAEQKARAAAKKAEQEECSRVLSFIVDRSELVGEPITYLRHVRHFDMTVQFSEASNLRFCTYDAEAFRSAFEHFGEEVATAHLEGLSKIDSDFSSHPLLLPVTNSAGDVVGIQGRSINPTCHQNWKFTSRGHSSLGFFGGKDLAHDRDRLVVLCEGPLDTFAMRSVHHRLSPKWGPYVAVGRAGASGGLSEEQVEQLQGRRVLIAYDGDEAGKKGQEAAAKKLYRVAESIQLLPVPDGLDVSEWLEVSK